MAKDYYVILGISSDATPDQIKTAYRQKAKSVHPDCSGGDCEPFHDVQQAYEVLSDPARRKAYDSKVARKQRVRRRSWALEPEPLIPTKQRTARDSFYDRQFSTFQEHFDRLWDEFEPWTWPQTGRDQDIHIEIDLTWEQARRGGEARVKLPVQTPCPACQGRGESWFFSCPHCRGRGVIESAVPLSISFPATVPDGAIVRLPLDQLGLYHTSLLVHFRVRW